MHAEHEDRWRGWEREHLWSSPDAYVRHEGYPVRVVNDQPAPKDWKRREVGFVAGLRMDQIRFPILTIFRLAGHR